MDSDARGLGPWGLTVSPTLHTISKGLPDTLADAETSEEDSNGCCSSSGFITRGR
jgi:hypothetical protein